MCALLLHSQVLWTALLHAALAEWLEALVMHKPIPADPKEDLLYEVSHALLTLIKNMSHADPRASIAPSVLGSLATLALNQKARDSEAVEAALKLFSSIFHGKDDSRKACVSAFFLKAFTNARHPTLTPLSLCSPATLPSQTCAI